MYKRQVWHDPDPDTQAQGTGYRHNTRTPITFQPPGRSKFKFQNAARRFLYFGSRTLINLYQRCSSCSSRDKEPRSDLLIAGAVSRVDRALAGEAEMWELR